MVRPTELPRCRPRPPPAPPATGDGPAARAAARLPDSDRRSAAAASADRLGRAALPLAHHASSSSAYGVLWASRDAWPGGAACERGGPHNCVRKAQGAARTEAVRLGDMQAGRTVRVLQGHARTRKALSVTPAHLHSGFQGTICPQRRQVPRVKRQVPQQQHGLPLHTHHVRVVHQGCNNQRRRLQEGGLVGGVVRQISQCKQCLANARTNRDPTGRSDAQHIPYVGRSTRAHMRAHAAQILLLCCAQRIAQLTCS